MKKSREPKKANLLQEFEIKKLPSKEDIHKFM